VADSRDEIRACAVEDLADLEHSFVLSPRACEGDPRDSMTAHLSNLK
jgi:hypothetical protein